MFPLILAFTAAPSSPITTPALLVRWNNCLLEYVQVQGAGTGSDVSIAVDALAACSNEKDSYAKALLKNYQQSSTNSESAIGKAVQQLADDEHAITLRVIALVGRLRQDQ